MEWPWIYELIGYAASVLVAVSLMMRSIVRLRVINLGGAATFTVYGLLIGAHPVAAVNLFIVFINLFHLAGLWKTTELFRILEVRPGSAYLREFLRFHERDIRRSQPGTASILEESTLAVFVLRDLVPAGLLLGEARPDGRLLVRLDYAIPQYRDFKLGRHLFRENGEWLRRRGINEVISPAGDRRHRKYLRRIGFVPMEDGESYRLPIG